MSKGTKTDPNTLIVLDGIRGISHADALAFLDGKRNLLDANSNAGEYLSLASEYESIGEYSKAKALMDEAQKKGLA